MPDSVFKDTPEYSKATIPGTVTNYKAVAFLIHSANATINLEPVENGQTLKFATDKITGLNDIDYDPGSGHIHITIIR